ncbi:MAG TPA: hypothetical protein ENL03_03670 [Phycisphaerae bacterium]|nr:hypothetical protein [Phycisphaerae bacterium]
MKLGQPFQVQWVVSILRNKHVHQNEALELIRMHTGKKAPVIMARYLRFDNPEVTDGINSWIVDYIGRSGGPRLKYYYNQHGDNPGKSANNRKVLDTLKAWLKEHGG